MNARTAGLVLTASAALLLPLVGCGGGGDSSTATTGTAAAGVDPAGAIASGSSLLERALSAKVDGAVNCGKQKLPPGEGKTITCVASAKDSEHGTLAGDMRLTRHGAAISYAVSLKYPGGVKARAGIIGLTGGRASIDLMKPH